MIKIFYHTVSSLIQHLNVFPKYFSIHQNLRSHTQTDTSPQRRVVRHLFAKISYNYNKSTVVSLLSILYIYSAKGYVYCS